MLNMMKADLYRVVRSKVVYLLLGIMGFLAVFGTWDMFPINIGANNQDGLIMERAYYECAVPYMEEHNMPPEEFDRNIYRELLRKEEWYKPDQRVISDDYHLYYVLFVLALVLIIDDMSTGSVKNTLSSDFSLKTYYLEKLILLSLMSVGILLIHNLFVFTMNIIFNGTMHSLGIKNLLLMTAFQSIPMLGYASILNCLAFVIRRKYLFIGVALPFAFAKMFIAVIIVIVAGMNVRILDKVLLRYMIAGMAIHHETSYIVLCAIICVILIVVTTLIGYTQFAKRDIR